MSRRIAVISLVTLSLANVSCSLMTKFEGWEAHQGGAAGSAGTLNGGRSGGDAGNAAATALNSGGNAESAAGSSALGGATSPGGTSASAGTAGNAVGSAGTGTAGQGAGGTGGTDGTSGFAGTSSGTVITGGSAGIAGASTTGGTATGGIAGSGGASTGGCPGTGGPAMVKLPQGFCIDSTEVTRAQYTAWLNTTSAATVNAQDVASCGWNTTFGPNASCMTDGEYCQGACDNHPQTCVDWCDAYSYCKGVGKRLCGKIGGGAADYANQSNATSQWYAACSSGGGNAYPYGNTYDGTFCNGADYQAPNHNNTTVVAGSILRCQAPVPYAGVFDLSGNVIEWEDSCHSTTIGSDAYCRMRGGEHGSGMDYLTCAYLNATVTRGLNHSSIGFRCCST